MKAIKVGVLLAPPPADLGGWLADAAAFDTAGADALWIDVTSDPALDPLAITAALAALTYRSLLVTALPAAVDDRTLATITRLSRGRFGLHGDRTRLTGIPDVERFHPLDEADPVGGGFVREAGEPERWVRCAWSGGRAAWQTAVAEGLEGGAAGLLVPAAAPLLDILRNPGEGGDRRDLQLAQG
jgi:hypothetical protein